MLGSFFGTALLVTVGIGALGVAMAAALENAREFPEAQAFADKHGFELTRGGVARPYRLVGRYQGLEVSVTRIVETRGDALFKGHRIEVELPGRLPEDLRVRVARKRLGGALFEDLAITCPDAEEWARLRVQHAITSWMVQAMRSVPGVEIVRQRLCVETVYVPAALMRLIDPMVVAAVGLRDALVWRLDQGRPAALPAAPARSLAVAPPPPRPDEDPAAAHSPAGPVAAMVAELQSGGTLESRGKFSLDAGRALERLRTARLQSRAAYILDVIRAGVARGASLIEIEGVMGGVRTRFDGPAFEVPELEQAAEAVFVAGEDGRAWSVRHLALGLQGALGTSPRAIEVETGRHRLILPGDGSAFTLEALDEAVEKTSIIVRTGVGRALMGGSGATLLAASSRPLVSNTVVLVGGKRRSFAPLDLIHFGRVPVAQPGVVGMVGFDVDEVGKGARVMFGQHAVMLAPLANPTGLDGYRAIFMLDDPDTDLTGLRLVDGRQRAELLWLAETSIPAAFAALARELSESISPANPEHALRLGRARQLVRRHLYGVPHRDSLESGPLAVLTQARLWPLAVGGFASTRELFEQAAATGVVGFQNRGRKGDPPRFGALDAIRLGPSDRALLIAWFGRALREV